MKKTRLHARFILIDKLW